MSDSREVSPAPPKGWPIVAAVAGETAIAALVWLGINELGHWRLTAGGCLAGLAGWLGSLLAGRWLRSRPGTQAWLGPAVEWAIPAVVLGVLNRFLARPLSLGQMLYAVLLVGGAIRAWRAWAKGSERRGRHAVLEPLRVLLLIAGAVAAVLPFFTERFLGGTDARWYAYVLRDFIDQLRGGRFPIFVGQGPFAWNGGIHPFRSAPIYLDLAGAWDQLTLHALSALALQHLTVIAVALAGTLGFYAAGVALAPRRRWEMAFLAFIYVSSPAWLGTIYLADAYMTFMTLAALPWVLYGNARTLRDNDGRGYGILAAGLALVWMCHPPIALEASLATVLLQGGAFFLGDDPAKRWPAALRGALLFAGMSAWYFVSMRDSDPLEGMSPVRDAGQLAGLALVLAGLSGAILRRRGWAWLLCLIPGGCLLAKVYYPWFCWLAVATALVAVVSAGLGRWGIDRSRHTCRILFASLLAAAGLTQLWLGPGRPELNSDTLQGLNSNFPEMERFFPFVPSRAFLPQANVELGVAGWILLAVTIVALFRSKSLAAQLFFVAGLLPVFSLLRVPEIGDFLIGYFPYYIGRVIGFPLTLRVLPITAALVGMGAVLWRATAPSAEGWRRAGPPLLLSLLAGLSGLQLATFVAHGWRITSSRESTQSAFRPENVVLERFNYDLLRMPEYFSNGETDPRLEFRLLDRDGVVLVDPDRIALRMEAAGTRLLPLAALQDPTNRRWLNLSPGLALEPGEHVLLRFEFNPTRAYQGCLLVQSEDGYRQYYLTVNGSGLDYGFGPWPGHSRVLSLWNSGVTTEHYRFTVAPVGPPSPAVEGDFATVVVSHYKEALSPVRVESLDPCVVRADAGQPGWLETPRAFLPGYAASVDGQPVPVAQSAQHLVMVPLTAGRHQIELRFRGTPLLWGAVAISAATWIGWLAGCRRRWRQGLVGASAPAA
jgi:hypothetical protein